VRGASRGDRNNRLNLAALRLGEFVAAGALAAVDVARWLEQAADVSGLIKEDGALAIRKTIESGLKAGMQKGKRDLVTKLAEVRAQAAERMAAGFGGVPAGPPDELPPDPAQADGPEPEAPERPALRPVHSSNRKLSAPPGIATLGGPLDRELARFPLTDLGNAERFRERCRDRLLWCRVLGWHWWDGRRWAREGAEDKVKLTEHAVARAIQDEAKWLAESGEDWEVQKGRTTSKYSELLRRWGRTSEARKNLTAMSDRAQAMLSVPPDALDSDPFKINVLNGTLIVRTGKCEGDRIEFKPHDPLDLITRLCPVVYDPTAQCPVYDVTLARVQPVPRVRRLLHQWSGLSLTDDVSEEKLVFFWGTGQNGKTKIVEAWAHVAGDYAQSIPIESFINEGRARGGGQATPDLAMLKGARYVYADEPERGSKLSESLVKLLTGGSKRVKVRELRMPYFNLKPTFKLTMAGNFRPRISGGDKQHGIWRRILMVEWGVTIPEEERDYALGQKLEAEASGILNRMLDGLRDWCENRLVIPPEVRQATEEYRSTSDPLGRFLADCTQPAPDTERVSIGALHAVFCAWARANGEREWTSQALGRALGERGYRWQHSGVNYWCGLRLTRTVDDYIDPATGKVREGIWGVGGTGEDSGMVPF
jgi:putative DNA primase/helicase